MKHLFIIIFLSFNCYSYSQITQKSKYGLKIPNQEYLDSLPTETFKPKSSKPIASSKDLTAFMPNPGNQGSQGSCVAWSVGYGLKSYQERIETSNNTLLFSPSFIFNNFKSTFPNCNEGIYYYEALDYLINYGICEWSEMPYNENDCNTKPTLNTMNNALKYKIEDWKTIYASQYDPINDLYEIKANIYYGRPVAIAVWLDTIISNFMDDESPNKPKFVWKNPLNDTNKSVYYHAMICVGYDDKTKEFKVLNSYGPNSGNSGYIYISYDAFKKTVYEAYYSTDSNNDGRYVYASKASNLKSKFGITDTSFNFYGWLKQGYYIHINDNMKISCAYLKKSADVVILRIYDTSSEKERMIGSYKFNSGDIYEIKYKGNNYSLELDKIGSTGYNIFRAAAFINFSAK